MPKDKFAFWVWLKDQLSPHKTFTIQPGEELKEYALTASTVIAYSKGLESSLMRHMWPQLPTLNYYDHGLCWTNPIEGAIAILSAGLGYGTTLYGNELEDNTLLKDETPNNFYCESTREFAVRWKDYSGAEFLSPFSAMRKGELFKIALRENVSFISCMNSTEYWCGKCPKCRQVYNLYKENNILEPPIKIW